MAIVCGFSTTCKFHFTSRFFGSDKKWFEHFTFYKYCFHLPSVLYLKYDMICVYSTLCLYLTMVLVEIVRDAVT